MTKRTQDKQDVFASADWYDRGINWDARFARELPVLTDVFGPPADGGVLDAGCGPGRHVVALTQRGYRMTGLDASPNMLMQARGHAADDGVQATFVEAPYVDAAIAGTAFDGVLCLANALASCGEVAVAQRSFSALAGVLRPGGKLFLQLLNFAKLRAERPAVRGPRVRTHAGVEYVSSRVYQFHGDQVDVTNVTFWKDADAWRQHAHQGSLCVIGGEQLTGWCAGAGLTIDGLYGGYDLTTFNPSESNDLILVARRQAE